MRFQVLFHSPHRGAFHFSVALLSAIGRQGVLSLGGWAPQIHASFHETRITRELLEENGSDSPTGLSPALAQLSRRFSYRPPLSLLRGSAVPTRPSQPPLHNACGLTCRRFGLLRFRSPLLTQSMLSFLSWGYLDVSVPPVGSRHLSIQCRVTGHDPCRVVPFGYLGVLAWLAARPSFSQLPHVLLRLLAPKHPPHTLRSLTMSP